MQQVIREECTCTGHPHKRFRQRYRDARQWVYRKPHGFTPVLYRPNAIQSAAKTGAWIWVTEGEKDADTLTALVAWPPPTPKGPPTSPPNWSTPSPDCNVAIVADRDLAGYQRAINLHERLHASAAQVVVLMPRLDIDKADVTDHVNAGLWDRADPFGGFTVITPDRAARHWPPPRRPAGPPTASTSPYGKPAPTTPRRGIVPGSARNAARWLAEAAEQLRAVQRTHQDLQPPHQPAALTNVARRRSRRRSRFSSGSPPTTGATLVGPQLRPQRHRRPV